MFGKPNNWILFPMALIVALLCCAQAAISQDSSRGKFSGEYFFYSGTLDDVSQPTAKDAKVGMWVSGPVAAQMFRHLGRTSKISFCGDEKKETRSREELICSRDNTGNARCYFGFDLRSGKSIGAIIC